MTDLLTPASSTWALDRIRTNVEKIYIPNGATRKDNFNSLNNMNIVLLAQHMHLEGQAGSADSGKHIQAEGVNMKAKILKALGAVGLAASMGISAPASATATLYLHDVTFGGVVTCADGALCDANPTVGVVTYIGPVGTWGVNVTTGLGGAFYGNPHLDLNSVDVSSQAGGELEIFMGDTDFLLGAGPTAFLGNIGGTTNGSIRWGMWVDNLNNLFGQQQLIGGIGGPAGPGAFSGSFSGVANLLDSPFSMIIGVEITHRGAGTTSFDFEGKVPEPTVLALLGIGLLGAGLGRRRKLS